MKKIATIIIILFLTSCSKEAVEPIDETTNLGHDNWAKVSLTFTEGEVHNNLFTGYKNDSNLTFKTVQNYTFSLENGIVVPKGDTIKLITGKNYGLEIKYFNAKEKLINSQFTTAEMALIHQHFFITNPVKGSVKQTEKNTIDYVYRDTNPTDKMIGEPNVLLRAKNDPIGLKGYFNVFKKPNHNFDLNIILVHVLAGSKLDKNGNAYPFFAPSKQIIGTRDFSQKIPVKIFTDINATSFINDIAKEFNMSKEKAQKEVNKRTLGKIQL